MEKRIQQAEEIVENFMSRLTSNSLFLSSVSWLLNANSYRKLWLRDSIESILASFEMPARSEQDKLNHKVEELKLRLRKLELELEKARLLSAQTKIPKNTTKSRSVTAKSPRHAAKAKLLRPLDLN